ncbi:MAG: RHS repeat-associated core domain-containing protein [Dehalococcoidia bacterium]|nr:RHS repeat-associated core domain-containing protein [Dehalococcoidia bacterium]
MSAVCERQLIAPTGSLANEFNFAGQQTDGTGLQYLRPRYYDPTTGVFLSREPMEQAPGWMGNPFGYAGANPARYLDSTGLVPVDGDRPVADCQVGYCASYGQLYDYGYPDAIAEWGSGTVIHWTLIGEYTLNRLTDLAKFLQSGLEAVGEGQIREAEFAASIGPRMHACAADVACAWAFTLAIHALAIVAAAVPLGVWGTAALELVANSWTIYSVKAQMEQPTSDRASPVGCRPAEAC